MEDTPARKRGTVIRTPDHRLRVFISSTLKELAAERDAVRASVLRMRLVPVMFEAGARPHPAADLYRAYLSQSHVFIGIYWQSYGWVGPGMDISGLEDEYVLSASMPRLIYIKSPASEREAGLQRMLARIQSENTASYKYFTSTEELGELVENDLALLLTETYEAASQSAPAEFAPRPLTNIPFPRNPLLGRETELRTVCEWLVEGGCGLVTLTGAGGAGKSRLALEAALELRERFPDGVYIVRLSPVSDPGRVLPAIAETLGLRENAQAVPVDEQLPGFLSDKQIMLILDNFEQVLAAAPQVAALLESCPKLKLLVTSRAPLRLRGERELPVAPLAVPRPGDGTDPDRLSQYASVQLFIQRAQGVRPDFKVTNENAPAVAEICWRLDGLPLAIELAAARIKLLHPQELLARLGRRFDILRGGTRDLPERQQTLRAAIDWSYNLLSEPARALFRRLAVFSGGCSLEAAEAICNPENDLGFSVLEEIESLVDFSMVILLEGLEERQRFSMLESIREYALERLEESGEAAQVRLLHARFFLEFAREVEPRIRSAERVRWRSLLEQDMENIRAVLAWALKDNTGLAIGQQIIVALAFYWAVGGPLTEGQQLTRQYLKKVDETTDPGLRAGLVAVDGALQLLQGDSEAAYDSLQQALEPARQAADKRLLIFCLLAAGSAALVTEHLELARDLLHEGLDAAREMGDEWSQVFALLWLSNVAAALGEREHAQDLFDQSLSLGRRQGDPFCLVGPLADVAQSALERDDLQKAEDTLVEVESLCRLVGENWNLAWALNVQAQINLIHLDPVKAGTRLQEALPLARQQGNTIALIMAILGTAVVIALRNQQGGETGERRIEELGTSARLCGAFTGLSDRAILWRGVGTRKVFDAMLAQAQATIEPQIWDGAFAAGVNMPFDEAVELTARKLHEAAGE